jgi:hypothetical protein
VGDLGERLRRGLILVAPSDSAAVALERAMAAGVDQLVVVDSSRERPTALGLLTLRDIEDALDLHAAASRPMRPARTPWLRPT